MHEVACRGQITHACMYPPPHMDDVQAVQLPQPRSQLVHEVARRVLAHAAAVLAQVLPEVAAAAELEHQEDSSGLLWWGKAAGGVGRVVWGRCAGRLGGPGVGDAAL